MTELEWAGNATVTNRQNSLCYSGNNFRYDLHRGGGCASVLYIAKLLQNGVVASESL